VIQLQDKMFELHLTGEDGEATCVVDFQNASVKEVPYPGPYL
jgi:hypothetical protein